MKIETTEARSHPGHKYTISYKAGVKGMTDRTPETYKT